MDQKEQKKPGQLALVALKNQNKSVELFKKPSLPAVKKKKTSHVILSEETYLKELGKIIQRDFFPDLEKIKAQNEYLDAIQNNDVAKLRELYSKYSSKRRPNETPSSSFDTPMSLSNKSPVPQSVRSNDSSKTTSSRKTIADHHSLSSFFDKYTSEDNQSFEEIIEAAEEKLKQKFAILYEAEDTSSAILQNALTLPGFEKQFQSTERQNKLDTWTYKNKNYLMYTPDGVEFTAEEKIEMAKRKQEIDHSNTRLIVNPFSNVANKDQNGEILKQNVCSDKVGLDGKTAEQQTPQIRGFNFVKSPSIAPTLGDCSPMMTWGSIEGTPFLLDASDTPVRTNVSGPSFRIAETSKRETLALQLAENASEKHRAKKMKAIEMAKKSMCASPQIRSSFERLNSMSPAAKRLSSISRIKDTWATPSPRKSTKSTPSNLVRINTPSTSLSKNQKPSDSDLPSYSDSNESTLTDNLLSIPTNSQKRSRASDFF